MHNFPRYAETQLANTGQKGRRAPSEPNGFTLLEVLVALAILGASLSIVFGVYSTVLDRTRSQQLQQEAQTLCASLLHQANEAGPNDGRDYFGTTPSGLDWRVHTEHYAADEQPNGEYALVKLTATVSWNEHGHEVKRTLSTLKLAPKVQANAR